MKLLFVLLLALVSVVLGSSHGEAPLSANLPQTDSTDLYAFRSYETGRSNWVTLIANWNPRQNPYGGPNYYPLSDEFYYEIHVDQNGDGDSDITYRWVFHSELANNGTGLTYRVANQDVPFALKATGTISAGNNANLNFLEYYRLYVVTPSSTTAATVSGSSQNYFVKPLDYVGTKTFPNYTAYAQQYYYAVDFPGCATPGRVFVGQRKESFHVNLGRIFDLLDFVPVDASSGFPGGINQSDSNNVIRYTNIISTILEVPISCIRGASTPVIGVWATARSIAGNRQKSRLAGPLFNELIIGLKDKDKWNRRRPPHDRRLLNYCYYPTFPAYFNSLFRTTINSALNTNYANIAPSNFPRRDFIGVFLTGFPGINYLLNDTSLNVELLRLNTSISAVSAGSQNSLAVIGGDIAGYPNGRRPGDDIVDIVLRVAMGILCHAGLGVCTPSQAPVGTVAFTDGAPVNASYFDTTWPYLQTPYAGSAYLY